jgi:hypothetical protein
MDSFYRRYEANVPPSGPQLRRRGGAVKAYSRDEIRALPHSPVP